MALLKVGKRAPDFSAADQHGQVFSLSSLMGKKVLLFFYPTDDTPTCTTQACNLRDNYKQLQQAGYHIVGISADDVKSHSKYATKYTLPFTLVADTDKKIVKRYGVWAQKTLFGKTYMGILRTSYVLDEHHIITHVIDKVKASNHASQVLDGQ